MKYNGLTLDTFQEEAIKAIDEGKSVLVSAPTGTGKTLVADYLIEQALNEDREIIYTAPIKALSNQKYREYSERFGSDKVGLVTGDMVINPYAPLRIMTTEILRNILLQESMEVGEESDEENVDETTLIPSDTQIRDLDRLEAVIIDEIHFLDDPDRGTVWEELLIYLPSTIRILGLSATLSNMEEFAEWLSEIRQTKVKVVVENKRSVPLQFTFVSKGMGRLSPKNYKQQLRKKGRDTGESRGSKKDKYSNKRNKKAPRGRRGGTSHLDVFDLLEGDHYPALYFIYSRKMTEKLSAQLADSNVGRSIGGRANKKELKKRLNDFETQYPKTLSRSLRRQLQQGIAFHHAGLHVAIKSLVESLYEARLIQVLYCTSTFALGINMPARTVIFDDVTKFNGIEIVPLSVREFMQMAGRAGRRGIDAHGDVVIKLDPGTFKEHEEVIQKFLRKESEPVSSSFNLSFNSVVNLLDRYDEEKIRRILERSFKSHQLGLRADSLSDQIGDMQDDDGKVDSKSNRKKIAHLRRLLNDAKRPRLWEQFQKKVAFLQSFDYLNEHMELNSPGRILKSIQFEEIFVSELILSGALESLSPEELFGVMTGLSQSLPRTARVRRPSDEKWWDIFDNIEHVFQSDIVFGAQKLVGNESTFTPELMPLGEMWATGSSLSEIVAEIDNPTDLSGDLVGAFRRAKDLVGQVRKVNWEDVERRNALRDLMRRVTRDEVEVIS